MKKIALEEHFTTPLFFKYNQGTNPFQDQLLDLGNRRLEAMDKAGIALAVLSITTPGVQAEPDTLTAVKRAHEANDLLAGVIQKYPKRFAGFAHLSLHDPKVAADELTRCVVDLGFKGALINGHTNGRYLDEEIYYPFWERVQDLGVPIYLHPRDPYDLPQEYHGHPELLGATWSWTAETAAHALRLVFGGTFERFPKVTIILGHMGETLPYLLWRLDSRRRIQLPPDKKDARLPSETIKSNIVITTAGVCSHASLVCALSALGENSVMFSVDYPYEDCTIAAEFIESAPISAATRAKVCYGNAERILQLAPDVESTSVQSVQKLVETAR
jgi:2,3-dihydroxybenzoate decarboxylase